jgi:hypothetical protein
MSSNVPPKSNTVVNAEMAIDKPHELVNYSMMTIEATAKQLARSHQYVTYRNTDERQTYVIIDRYRQSHNLAPGQQRELDMAADEVESFIKNTRQGRGIYYSGPKERIGLPFPAHPVQILGVSEIVLGAEHAKKIDLKIAREHSADVTSLLAEKGALEAKLAEQELQLNAMASSQAATATSSGKPQRERPST